MRCSLYFAAALTCAVLASMLAAAPARGEHQDGLELVIGTPRSLVLLGEPLAVSALVANKGEDTAAVVPDLTLDARFLTYWVQDHSGAIQQYLPRGVACTEGVPVALYPGEHIADTDVMLWDSVGGHIFPVPGEYRVVATFTDPVSSLRSNVLVINVVQPEGADAQALPFIFDKDAAEFLMLPSYQFQRGIALLQELLTGFPDSAYAPYAAYVLAWRASTPGWFSPRPGSGMERIPADYEQAVAGFERVVREWPDSVVADDAQYELARTYLDMGGLGVAGEALAAFFEKFAAASDRLEDAVRLAEELGWETARSGDTSTPSTQWTALRKADGSNGFTVTWLPDSATARVVRGKISLEVQVGRRVAVLGERRIPLTAPARLEHGRMLVPRSFAQLLPRLLAQGRQLDPIPLEPLATVGG